MYTQLTHDTHTHIHMYIYSWLQSREEVQELQQQLDANDEHRNAVFANYKATNGGAEPPAGFEDQMELPYPKLKKSHMLKGYVEGTTGSFVTGDVLNLRSLLQSYSITRRFDMIVCSVPFGIYMCKSHPYTSYTTPIYYYTVELTN